MWPWNEGWFDRGFRHRAELLEAVGVEELVELQGQICCGCGGDLPRRESLGEDGCKKRVDALHAFLSAQLGNFIRCFWFREESDRFESRVS